MRTNKLRKRAEEIIKSLEDAVDDIEGLRSDSSDCQFRWRLNGAEGSVEIKAEGEELYAYVSPAEVKGVRRYDAAETSLLLLVQKRVVRRIEDSGGRVLHQNHFKEEVYEFKEKV